MPTIEQQPRQETPKVPERLAYREGFVGLRPRLLLGGNALNPRAEVARIEQASLGSFDGRNYTVFHQASFGERKTHWQGREGDDFERQRRQWIDNTTKTFQEAQVFFTSNEQGRRWSQAFANLNIGIDTGHFTTQSAENLYNRYFTGEKRQSNIKRFVADIMFAYTKPGEGVDYQALRQDLTGIQWLANIFGNEYSCEIVAQLVDAEVQLQQQPEALITAANEVQAVDGQEKLRVNRLLPREQKLLQFLWNDRPQPSTEQPPPDIQRMVEAQRLLANEQQQQKAIEKLPEVFKHTPLRYKFLLTHPDIPLVMAGLKPATDLNLPGQTYDAEELAQFAQALAAVDIQIDSFELPADKNGNPRHYAYLYNPNTLSLYAQANADLCPPYNPKEPLLVWQQRAIEQTAPTVEEADRRHGAISGILYGFPRSAIEDYIKNRPHQRTIDTYNETYWVASEPQQDVLFREEEKRKFFEKVGQSQQYQQLLSNPQIKQSEDAWNALLPEQFRDRDLETTEANREAIIQGRGFEEIARVGWEKYRKALQDIPYAQFAEKEVTHLEQLRRLAQNGHALSEAELEKANSEAIERAEKLAIDLPRTYPRNGPLPYFAYDSQRVSKLQISGKNYPHGAPHVKVYCATYAKTAPEAYTSLLKTLEEEGGVLDKIAYALYFEPIYQARGRKEPYEADNNIILYVPREHAHVMEKIARAVQKAKQEHPEPWNIAQEDQSKAREFRLRRFKIPLDDTLSFVELAGQEGYDWGKGRSLQDELDVGYVAWNTPIDLPTFVEKMRQHTAVTPEPFQVEPQRRKHMPGLLFTEINPTEPNPDNIIAGRGFEEIERVGWEKYRQALTHVSYGQMMEYQLGEIDKLKAQAATEPQLTEAEIKKANEEAVYRFMDLQDEFEGKYGKGKGADFVCDTRGNKWSTRGKDFNIAGKPITRLYFTVNTRQSPQAYRALFEALQREHTLNQIDLTFYPENIEMRSTRSHYDNTIIIYLPTDKQTEVMPQVARAVISAKNKQPQAFQMNAGERATALDTMLYNFKIPLDEATSFVEMTNINSYDSTERWYIGREFDPNYTSHYSLTTTQELFNRLKPYTPQNPGEFKGYIDYSGKLYLSPSLKKRRKYMPGLLFAEAA